MKRFHSLLAIASVIITISGCQEKGETPAPVIKSDCIVYDCSYEEGEYSFGVTISNPTEGEDLSASCSSDWIKLKSIGENSVTFSFSANPTTEKRSALLVLKYKGAADIAVTINQDGKPEIKPETPVINIPSTSQSVDYKKQEFSFAYTISNPREEEVMKGTSDKEWLTIFRVRASEVICNTTENTEQKDREAVITFSYPDAKDVTITVKQAAHVTPVINVDKKSVEFDAGKNESYISYTITDPVEGESLKATSGSSWISISETTAKSVLFSVEANTSSEERQGSITLSYKYADKITVSILQRGKK